MAEHRIKVPRAADKALIACFKELSNITGLSHVNISTLGFNNIGIVDFNDDLPDSLNLILEKNSAIIDVITFNVPGLIIRFYRGGNYAVADKSGVFDEVILSQDPKHEPLDGKVVVEIVTAINKKLKAFDPKRSGFSLAEEQVQFEAIHVSTIERLESLNEELIRRTHDYRMQLDAEQVERAEKLQALFDSKSAEKDEEFKHKESNLANQVLELEAKRKELDDSSNTHARREIRRDILKEIKSRQARFSLTDGTNGLRKPIGFAMIGLIGIFVVLALTSVNEFYLVLKGDDLNKILITGIKQAVYSAGAIGSVIFLIRWMNRWFELHSQSEFALKHFELDMERASWLVETSLEWKDAKGTAIPSELLESLSNNLFSSEKEKIDPLQHPADQLASALLGSASTIKLKAGDSVLKVDPKKLSKTKPVKNKP